MHIFFKDTSPVIKSIAIIKAVCCRFGTIQRFWTASKFSFTGHLFKTIGQITLQKPLQKKNQMTKIACFDFKTVKTLTSVLVAPQNFILHILKTRFSSISRKTHFALATILHRMSIHNLIRYGCIIKNLKHS